MSAPIEWRQLPGYEGIYDVSSEGRIKSWHQHHGKPGPRLLNPSDDGQYMTVALTRRDGTIERTKLHRVVTLAFLGPQPAGLVVRHLNGDHRDNSIKNLVYGTRSENNRDTVAHGRNVCANRTHCPKGHPYDEINTGTQANRRGRYCRQCERERKRQWRALARATP